MRSTSYFSILLKQCSSIKMGAEHEYHISVRSKAYNLFEPFSLVYISERYNDNFLFSILFVILSLATTDLWLN
jgi:hypothetical protein